MSESTKKGRKTLNALHHPVVDFWRREVGGISSRNFSNRFSASENLVMRLKRYRKLGRKRNEANLSSVSFNDEGGVLLAGEDDRGVTLWDWERGKMKLSVPVGQNSVIFDAKFMPLSNDRSIVTCAGYGGVRHVSLGEGGKVETSVLSSHTSPRKIAIVPGSPQIFYTCGNHGLVQHFDLRTEAPTNLFTCQPVCGSRIHPGLDAIAIDPRNCNLLAVGGNIDGFARLYDIRKCQCDGRAVDHFYPPNLIDNSRVGIAGLAFSEQSELLVSYYQEFIYVFARDMGLGQNPIPVVSKSKSTSPKDHILCSVPLVYKGHKNSYALRSVKFFGPSSEYVVSGSECGRIFIWRKKDGELIRVMRAGRFDVITSIEPHPHIPVLASLSGRGDLKLWTPTATKRATLPKKKRQV